MVPVSSSAQLVLLPWLLRWEQPTDRTAFAAGLHAGSCVGLAWALRSELAALDRRTAGQIAAASVPAALAGLAAADAVEQRLGRPPQLAALLAAAGALLWWADARAEHRADAPGRRPAPSAPQTMITSESPGVSDVIMVPASPPPEPSAPPHPGPPRHRAPAGLVTHREATYAALAQVTALVPGVSRSGATLTALRLAGVERDRAQRFTLLLSLPVTAGAAALTLARADPSVARAVAPGAVAAAVAGAATATLAARRGGGSARGAALYRLGLAAVVARRLLREGEQ